MTDSSSGRPADAPGPTQPERVGATPRDASYWAKAVRALEVGEVSAGAVNLNVAGRRLVGPVQGFGKLWQSLGRLSRSFVLASLRALQLMAVLGTELTSGAPLGREPPVKTDAARRPTPADLVNFVTRVTRSGSPPRPREP